MDNPQRHQTPHQVIPPPIPPLHLNVPPPPPEVIPGDDPFAFPAGVPVPQAGPVEFNGRQYHHLPPVLAEAVQNLALPPAPPRGRDQDRGHAHIPARPVEFNGNQYHHLPPVLAEAIQNLAPPGQGQDHGHGHGHVHIPARPVEFNGNQYHHLPPVLAEAVQNLAPLQAAPAPQPLIPVNIPLPPVLLQFHHLPQNLDQNHAAHPPLQPLQEAPAPQPLIPVVNVPPPLPLARQPFNRNWPVHHMGRMDIACSDCGALHWASEKLVNSPKFGMCCNSGKIKVPRLDDPPPELLHLLSGQEDICKKFRDYIRNYNNALAMTSLGCNQDTEINRDGGGPFVFRVQGRLYHRIGSLLPQPESSPVYAQLYIYDPQEALEFRMNNAVNASLDRATMQTLQDMLYRRHPGVQLYKQAFELTQHMGPDQQCKIALRFDHHTDHRRYNLPTDTSNEIAVILPGDGDQPTAARDIILNRRGGPLQEISDMHPLYPSLHYVLLFATGQLGWHPHIPLNSVNENQVQGGDNNTRRRKKVTQAEYFRYRLFPRMNESNHIFMAGKLFQEYAVDSWATTEQSRLNWVKLNQSTIRADTYQGLTDAVAADPTTHGRHLGQRLILPSSFSGSSRNMIQHCQDALAINRHFHGADFLLTMTADPNWPEIKEALLPGQTPADRPDLAVRVFHAKVEEMKQDIFKHGYLGQTVARVWTIEFQKRGLPHIHMIIFLHRDSKLHTPDNIDTLLSAEFPDEEEEPELFELVKKHMVHTPCGPNNPTAPCMKDGKCSKGFPKPFREETTINEDSYTNLRRRNTGKTYQVRGHQVDN